MSFNPQDHLDAIKAKIDEAEVNGWTSYKAELEALLTVDSPTVIMPLSPEEQIYETNKTNKG